MTREILGREAARLNTDAACFQCTQNSAPKVFGAGRTGNKACVPLFGRDAVEGSQYASSGSAERRPTKGRRNEMWTVALIISPTHCWPARQFFVS